MAGFRKADPKQAFLKMVLYGPSGSGKTASSLLIAEGLARSCGKRVAFVDTERGTDFYAMPVPERAFHPEPFDFDAIYTRSITEVTEEVAKIDTNVHGVVIVDSITHLWEAAKNSYTGPKSKNGQIPLHAWGKIKAPYKQLMEWAVNSKCHVIICGRQGQDFAEDESGQMTAAGYKLKAEGETQYEPHICIRLEQVKPGAAPRAVVEKDRSSVLQGKIIEWPNFDTIARPLLPLLGKTQATVPTEAGAANRDAERMAATDAKKAQVSKDHLRTFAAQMELCKTPEELACINKMLTPSIKEEFTSDDLAKLRAKWTAASKRIAAIQAEEPQQNGGAKGIGSAPPAEAIEPPSSPPPSLSPETDSPDRRFEAVLARVGKLTSDAQKAEELCNPRETLKEIVEEATALGVEVDARDVAYFMRLHILRLWDLTTTTVDLTDIAGRWTDEMKQMLGQYLDECRSRYRERIQEVAKSPGKPRLAAPPSIPVPKLTRRRI